MASPTGVDKERSDEEREHRRPQVEKRRATLIKVSNPIFAVAKMTGENKKQPRENLFSKQLLAFHMDYDRFFKKEWHLQRESNPCCRDENPVS